MYKYREPLEEEGPRWFHVVAMTGIYLSGIFGYYWLMC